MPGCRAGSGEEWAHLNPEFCFAFLEDGTRNAEPHIGDGETSVHTTDRMMRPVVVMHAAHRRRRRGLWLQTRRFHFHRTGIINDAGFSAWRLCAQRRRACG
jgi:hypothetical protein